ncbi:hypothetical protein CDAR_446621 [Caerostris darwini]|uniref:Uncharacterized protein n=1 Tax=Caerostris darwini TaxID=1538125 RepID=A0AAV4PLI0_9ARAC|nr:hypothetical protein CDAR_446621 [Caerostris darwini]
MDAYTIILSPNTFRDSFIIQAPKLRQGPHRAAAEPIQSNVFDAISERHRGYEAAVHGNSLLLITNRENFLRSTPLESELPTDWIEMRRGWIAKYVPWVIGANNQTNQAIDNRLPFPHSPQRTDAFRPHRTAAAAPIQSNVFDAISEHHRGYEVAVHRNSLLLIANRDFLRSTPWKVSFPPTRLKWRDIGLLSMYPELSLIQGSKRSSRL